MGCRGVSMEIIDKFICRIDGYSYKTDKYSCKIEPIIANTAKNGVIVCNYKQGLHYNWKKRFIQEYTNDVRHGICCILYHNKRINILQRYANGRLTGPMRYYHSNGALNYIIRYPSSAQGGYLYTYYANGNMESSFTYENNKQTGEYIKYYSDGVWCRCNVVDEYYVSGIVRWYDNTGKIIKEFMPGGRSRTYTFAIPYMYEPKQ